MRLKEFISSISELEGALDKISQDIKDVKLSKHFIQRINDRDIDINNVANTISVFLSRYENSLKQSHKIEISGLIKNMLSDLNIAIAYDTNGTMGKLDDDVLKLVTVMKKKNFIPNNRKDTIYKVRV